VHDLRDHEAHSWLLRHQGSAGERATNEATVSLVTSRCPGTNSDVVVVVVMAAPPGTAGSRSPGTTRIIDPQSVVRTTELALPIASILTNPGRGRPAGTLPLRAAHVFGDDGARPNELAQILL
jgi:hypothetical protein